MERYFLSELQEGHTLEVFRDGEAIFSSSGHWLHPLFELEDFIKENNLNPQELSLHDSIQGRAAAALTVRLGIKKVNCTTISSLALSYYRKVGIEPFYEKSVPKILCKTEDFISESMSEDEIYELLRIRAQR
ncbi:MAG: DUF1893 domain-containing protein [Sphaerochaetaceae bacterium]|nr:DUF1893 domain-containing protein [Sphaerochaetaceae bacterium]